MHKTTKETINNVVWKACDSFRGTLDGTQYKDYVLTMLFVKYLSDFYREKLEQLHDKYKGKQNRIAKAIKLEKFILDETCTFEYLLSKKEASNLGEEINKVLLNIEELNPEKLEGIFRSIDFNNQTNLGKSKERNAILRHLLEDFNDKKLDLRPSMLAGNDVIGDAYEYLIAHFASDAGKKGGEFFTPSQVSTLLAKLAGAKEGARIYDPACGSGSLLIKAAKEINSDNFALFGQEKNGQTQTLSRMNMFLHEIGEADIRWGDTLRNPLHLVDGHLMKFDIVVANPPFSLDKWGYDELDNDTYHRFDYGLPPKSKGDYAFVLHMLASLNAQGTMGVVLPHGVLFRGGSEGKIRQQILANNLLDTVIGLPSNLFFGTSIPVAILIFKKNRTPKDILFIDASKEFSKNKNQNTLEDTHIKKILTTYKNRSELEKYSHIASLKEIQTNDYNLNIPRYVDTFEQEEPVNIAQTKQDIEALENELKGIKKQMAGYLEELGL
ncbi:MAG: type I restriction-modification system subunit M [Methylococcales symbiont of Hymedesmia sp. n. MRB-2018]|nr:MAG: type I restriction-modification system subunit M [Methylococcales symbiont of Hymedesmia sp. n. MRB-2018]